MKIQYASDLHLEFPENRNYLRAHPLQPEGDVLLLAGDIVLFSEMHQHHDFFKYVSEHFPVTYWLPGNHEYYYSDISRKTGVFHEEVFENIFLVNNFSVTKNGVRFVFSTLWSKISDQNSYFIEKGMTDFRVIKNEGRKFTWRDYNALHQQSCSFLEKELSQKTTDKTIVVTHHVPTYKNYPQDFRGELLNEAFATELSSLIEPAGPDYWIFGHHHSNMPDFKIGKTSLCTNQLGYVRYHEEKGFDFGKVITL